MFKYYNEFAFTNFNLSIYRFLFILHNLNIVHLLFLLVIMIDLKCINSTVLL